MHPGREGHMAGSQSFSVQKRVALKGSKRQPFEGAKPEDASRAVDEEPITVSVVMAPKQPIDATVRMTREEFAQRHGADPATEDMVRRFAEEFGLTVTAPEQRGRRTLHLSGSRDAIKRAFGVKLENYETPAGRFRVREGEVMIPEELAPHVVAVLGLDNRPQARPHFRVATPHAGNVSYTPVQVAQLYGFPANASAAGQTIGLLELGGGFEQSDITDYFQGLGLAVPSVTAVSVDGGTNSPGDPNGADGEVMLDIEVSGAVAPGSKIAVYFAPNTDQGFIDAVPTAVHATK